jgi:hypothetical protein
MNGLTLPQKEGGTTPVLSSVEVCESYAALLNVHKLNENRILRFPVTPVLLYTVFPSF